MRRRIPVLLVLKRPASRNRAAVGNAMRAAAGRPDDVRGRLSVRRRYAGKLAPVEFERMRIDILR